MSGKPTIPEATLKRIRKLRASGEGRRAIAAKLGVSIYTVRKAVDPTFIERERERWRDADAQRADRSQQPDRIAYQAAYADSDEYRELARTRMKARRLAASKSR